MFIFTTILSWLGNLLGGPFVKAALAAYQAKLTSENTTLSYKDQIALQELQLQSKEQELQTQYRIATIGRWYEPEHIMGYAVAIYFGKLLLRLFQTSRRFNVEIQPQLVMLQKTLLNIEGLGRQLDPDLDLWSTAKPFLERWMSEQVGWRGLLRTLRHEAPYWASTLPQLPRLVHRALSEDRLGELRASVERLAAENARRNDLLTALLVAVLAALILSAFGLL